jgi:hypothetical protein
MDDMWFASNTSIEITFYSLTSRCQAKMTTGACSSPLLYGKRVGIDKRGRPGGIDLVGKFRFP